MTWSHFSNRCDDKIHLNYYSSADGLFAMCKRNLLVDKKVSLFHDRIRQINAPIELLSTHIHPLIRPKDPQHFRLSSIWQHNEYRSTPCLQHMLEGYDKDWVYTDASKRFASYTNLDPGHYTFKVKGSNNDGVWNETAAELKIIITPHSGKQHGSRDNSEGFTCSGAFGNCSEMLAKIEATQPDVVLMDIQMPVVSGIEAVKIIKQHFPRIKILMQTVFEDDDKIFQSICNGAEGYVLKNKPVEEILESIKEIHEGGAPMSPAIALKVIRMFKQNLSGNAGDSFSLSVREKEILKCLVEGMSYKMIADNCFITLETVGGHIKNIYRKLQVHSKSEAVVKAIKGKIV